MKSLSYSYLLPLAFSILSCSGEKEEVKSSTPLSEQELKFEIYDSLVVDYLGNLTLMDISPDGDSFLLIDLNTDTIFVADKEGSIFYTYKKQGEGPEEYTRDRYGLAKFLNNTEFLVPSTSGIFRYQLDGKLERKYKPEFDYFPSLIVTNANNVLIHNGKIYSNYGGRYNDDFGRQGIEYQQNSTQLEVIDLESGAFEGIIPFPESSKFSSKELSYRDLTFQPNFSIHKNTLYLNFRNEPKIYAYSLDDFTKPKSVSIIPFPEFMEKTPEGSEISDSFNFEDLFIGTINTIIPMENGEFMVDYLGGLTKEKYSQAMEEAEGDINKIWPFAAKLNSGGRVIFNGNEISSPIEKPEILGNLNKYVSKDEIWFSLNFSEAENDYSVIYKVRIVSK